MKTIKLTRRELEVLNDIVCEALNDAYAGHDETQIFVEKILNKVFLMHGVKREPIYPSSQYL